MGATMRTGSAARAGHGRAPLGALSGIAFIIVLIVGAFGAPMPPQPGDAPEAIRAYYVEHASAVRFGVFTQALAAALFLVFVCWLARALSRSGRPGIAPQATLGAGVLVLAATLAGMAAFGTLGFGVAESGDPTLVRALFDLGNMALNVGDFMLAVLVGVPSVVALREGVLPRWVALFGLVVTAGWTVAGISILVREGALAGPSGPYGTAVLLAFLLWVVATSVALFLRDRRAARLGADAERG
ncbi:hypothetical protein HRbin12_00144 [bacterium HR12]|nr:hypothetical protein HRbin12_00144 [bacterium HR12]